MPFEEQFDATPGGKLPIDTGVNFLVDNQPVNVELNDVARLFSDIDRYNRQFSMGAMLARSIGFANEPEEDAAAPPTHPLSDEPGNQQITAFFLISAHKQLLHNTGLSLEPVAGGPTLMLEGAQASQGEMAIHINSRDNFTSFLRALNPAQIDATGVKGNLEKVPGLLSRQIMTTYTLGVPESDMREVFEGMEQIIAEYKRLGMTAALSELEDYFNHWNSGDLLEYVAIKRRGLFNQPGEYFGPADWQRDSSPQYLESRWDEALAILTLAKQNPKAADLYNNLYQHFCICLGSALQQLPTLHNIPESTRTKAQTILEAAQQKLDFIVVDSSQS